MFFDLEETNYSFYMEYDNSFALQKLFLVEPL